MKKIIILLITFLIANTLFSEDFHDISGFTPGMNENDVRAIITEKGYTLSKHSNKTSVVIDNIQITDEPILKDKTIGLYLGFYDEKLMTVSLWLDSLSPKESKEITLSLKEKYKSKRETQETTVVSQFTTDVYFYTSNWFIVDISTWDGESFDISFRDAELWFKSEAERRTQWVNDRKAGR